MLDKILVFIIILALWLSCFIIWFRKHNNNKHLVVKQIPIIYCDKHYFPIGIDGICIMGCKK